MIYEFAVDPEVLSNWKDFRYLIEKFGVEYGRLISRFPKTWTKMVYESCENCKEVERKRIEEKLKNINHLLIKNSREYFIEKIWIENAIEQHNKKNFRAIITNDKIENNFCVLNIGQLDENTEKFKVETGLKIKRKAKELGECLSPLLVISKEVLFVDPHFAPDAGNNRFINTLKEFLKYLKIENVTRVEYHLKFDCDYNYFRDNCNLKLRNLIPPGLKIKFIRWKERGVAETLHPRYILNERGGVSIEKGLDEGQGEDTTDIKLLDSNLYKQRWEQYQKETSPFEFVDEIEIIR